MQDPGLARRRHRREDGLPTRELVGAIADPTRHRVHRPGAYPRGKDGVGEPVDLDDHEAGSISLLCGPLRQEAGDEQTEIRAATIHTEEGRQRRVDRGIHERCDQCRREAIDLHAVGQRHDHQEREDLEHEDENRQEHERPWSDEGQKDRTDDRVEQRHQSDRDRRIDHSPDGHARDDRGGQQQSDRGYEQGDHEALQESPWAAPPFPQDAGLRAVELDECAHACDPSEPAVVPAAGLRRDVSAPASWRGLALPELGREREQDRHADQSRSGQVDEDVRLLGEVRGRHEERGGEISLPGPERQDLAGVAGWAAQQVAGQDRDGQHDHGRRKRPAPEQRDHVLDVQPEHQHEQQHEAQTRDLGDRR